MAAPGGTAVGRNHPTCVGRIAASAGIPVSESPDADPDRFGVMHQPLAQLSALECSHQASPVFARMPITMKPSKPLLQKR